jgi:hypothetical protein
MKELAESRAEQLRNFSGFEKAGVYDPESVGGTHVIYVLHDASDPEAYGGLPKDPHIPIVYTIWKHFLKPIGLFAAFAGLVGIFFQYISFGPRRTLPQPPRKDDNGDR